MRTRCTFHGPFAVMCWPLASPHDLQLRSFRQRLPAAEDMVTFREMASISCACLARNNLWTLTVDTSGRTNECKTVRDERQVKTRRAGHVAKHWQRSSHGGASVKVARETQPTDAPIPLLRSHVVSQGKGHVVQNPFVSYRRECGRQPHAVTWNDRK